MTMFRNASPLILIVALLIAFYGCDGDNGNGPDPDVKTFPENAEDYFPMEQGDVWYYTYEENTTEVRRIGEKIAFRGDSCMELLQSRSLHVDSLYECWTIDSIGFQLYLLDYDLYTFPPLTIPFDLRSDKAYRFDSDLALDGDSGIIIATVKGDLFYQGLVTKTVPAGTFQDCVKLYYDDGVDPYHEYYAPGVGLLDNGSIVLDSAIIGSVSYGM